MPEKIVENTAFENPCAPKLPPVDLQKHKLARKI
jgi:hypothetical protein